MNFFCIFDNVLMVSNFLLEFERRFFGSSLMFVIMGSFFFGL